VTSILTTFMIVTRIYSTTNGDDLPTQILFRKRYKDVVDMLIQSCAMYSLVVLGAAILDFLPLAPGSTIQILSASDYMNVLVCLATVSPDT